MTITGGCRCGAVRYRIEAEPSEAVKVEGATATTNRNAARRLLRDPKKSSGDRGGSQDAMDLASVGWRRDGAVTWAIGSVAAVAVDRSSVRRKMVLRTMQ